MSFADAQRIADAVLWEGYLLYPYRASARKNQVRWQFGVLVPAGYAEAAASSERPSSRTECLLADAEAASVDLRLRFLQLQSRSVEQRTDAGAWAPVAQLELDGELLLPWDEATEQHVDVAAVTLAEVLASPRVETFEIPGGDETESLGDAVRIRRRRWSLSGELRLAAERDGDLVRLRVDVVNTAPWAGGADRDAAMRLAFLGAHTLLVTSAGRFVSLLEPDEAQAGAARRCANEHTWPVLVGGDGTTLLSSPIILYDQPEIAPESPGDLFDSTEIDEILTLRIMTLTDAEKREARATDPRAQAIIDRSESMPAEMLERLHGAVRMVQPAQGTFDAPPPVPDITDPFSPDAPFWEPEARVDPTTATVAVGDGMVSRGSLVRLNPGPRGDSMDMFVAGRVARVEAVFETLEEEPYVAVTLLDDPASEMHALVGRYLYYRPGELELVAEAATAEGRG